MFSHHPDIRIQLALAGGGMFGQIGHFHSVLTGLVSILDDVHQLVQHIHVAGGQGAGLASDVIGFAGGPLTN